MLLDFRLTCREIDNAISDTESIVEEYEDTLID